MLTLFAIPKPFEGHIGVIQENALCSWTRLGISCEVILLGDERGTAEAAARFGFRHVPSVERNAFGTPLVNSVFNRAERASPTSVMCYVNADIILTPDFAHAVRRVFRDRWPALMVGRRWDVVMEGLWDFQASDTEQRLRDRVRRMGRLDPPQAIDYFLYPRGLWSAMPPFAIGRMSWDNWLIYHARALDLPVIDATRAVTAIHQRHDYAHVPNGSTGVQAGPEARRNFELLGGADCIFDVRDSTWVLTRNELKPALAPSHLYRRLRTALLFRPQFRSVVHPLVLILRSIRHALQRRHSHI